MPPCSLAVPGRQPTAAVLLNTRQAPTSLPAAPPSYDASSLTNCLNAHTAHVASRAMSAPLLEAWATKAGGDSTDWDRIVAAVEKLLWRLDMYRQGKWLFPMRCYDCGKWVGLDVLGRKVLLFRHKASGLLSATPGDKYLHWLCDAYVCVGDSLPPKPKGHADKTVSATKDSGDEAGDGDF